MRKVKYLIISILITSIFIINVEAASISISCPSSAYVGDIIKCTVSANDEGGLGGGIKGSISYTGLTFNSFKNISGSNYLTVTESIIDGAFDMTESSSKSLAEYTFKANAEGTAKVVVDCEQITSYEFNTLTCSGAEKSITISKKVEPPKEDKKEQKNNNTDKKINTDTKEKVEEKKSSNTELKDLSVDGFEVIEAEDGNYTLMVDNDVEEITIKADVLDKKSKITGIGTKKLYDGENNFEIIVTSEDGTTKTYSLVVTRMKKSEVIDVEDDEPEDKIITEKESKNNNKLYIPILGAIILIIIIIVVKKKSDEK